MPRAKRSRVGRLLLARARSLANLARSLTCSSRGGVITTAKDPIDAGPASSAAECLRRPPHTLVRLGRRVVQALRRPTFARLQRRVGVVVLNVLRGILVGGTDRPLVVLPPAVPPRGLLLRWKLQGAIAAASAAPRPIRTPSPRQRRRLVGPSAGLGKPATRYFSQICGSPDGNNTSLAIARFGEGRQMCPRAAADLLSICGGDKQ